MPSSLVHPFLIVFFFFWRTTFFLWILFANNWKKCFVVTDQIRIWSKTYDTNPKILLWSHTTTALLKKKCKINKTKNWNKHTQTIPQLSRALRIFPRAHGAATFCSVCQSLHPQPPQRSHFNPFLSYTVWIVWDCQPSSCTRSEKIF